MKAYWRGALAPWHQVVVPDRQDGKKYNYCHADLRSFLGLTAPRRSVSVSWFVRHWCSYGDSLLICFELRSVRRARSDALMALSQTSSGSAPRLTAHGH